jgi:hypothetical protein
MPGNIVHNGAVINCPHGGLVTFKPSGPPRVLVSGTPVATSNDQSVITGCANTPACVSVQWNNLAARVRANLSPLLLQSPPSGQGNGACLPGGTPVVVTVQPRVLSS